MFGLLSKISSLWKCKRSPRYWNCKASNLLTKANKLMIRLDSGKMLKRLPAEISSERYWQIFRECQLQIEGIYRQALAAIEFGDNVELKVFILRALATCIRRQEASREEEITSLLQLAKTIFQEHLADDQLLEDISEELNEIVERGLKEPRQLMRQSFTCRQRGLIERADDLMQWALELVEVRYGSDHWCYAQFLTELAQPERIGCERSMKLLKRAKRIAGEWASVSRGHFVEQIQGKIDLCRRIERGEIPALEYRIRSTLFLPDWESET